MQKYYVIVTNKYNVHHLEIFEEVWAGPFWFHKNAQVAAYLVSNHNQVIKEQLYTQVVRRPKYIKGKVYPHR